MEHKFYNMYKLGLGLPVITGMGPTHRIRELQPYQSLKLS